MRANRLLSSGSVVEEHKAYHWIMGETYIACPGAGPADRSIGADVLLREEPDEEEEDEEEDDGNEEDDGDEDGDDGDEGYSE
jgi:hypothetical protein